MDKPSQRIRQARSPRDPWQRSLETLNRASGFAGSLLVSRDGLCVINACPRLRKPEVACAMGAAMLAAAETMAAELGLDRKASFQLNAGKHTLLGVAASDELMVITLVEPDMDPEDARHEVERVVAEVARETPW